MPLNKHFNKELYDINVKDLEKYFSEDREETSTLEFKSGKVEIDKIYREICAFLNTEGGSLIIGSPNEEKKVLKKQEKKVYKGKLEPSKFRDKDWLIQKISSNIVPLPASIKIHEIELKTGKAFIIDVAKSQNTPHQCSNDGKFYIRMETESKPAPNGIVKALFNQVKSANLFVDFDVEGKHRLKITAQLKNRNLMPAEDVNIHLAVYAEKLYVEDEADNLLRRNLHNGFTAIERLLEQYSTLLFQSLLQIYLLMLFVIPKH